jgi:hypothetical protein
VARARLANGSRANASRQRCDGELLKRALTWQVDAQQGIPENRGRLCRGHRGQRAAGLAAGHTSEARLQHG